MYHRFSSYYDELLRDEEAYQWWFDFFKKHHNKNTVLELASGTGEITRLLAKEFQVTATDISEDMLAVLKDKDTESSIKDTYVMDMRDLNQKEMYDNIICFCDSINYLISEDDLDLVINRVYNALKSGGIFMFDMHTPDRLEEFEDPFIETGQLNGTDYQWTIFSEDENIYHHLVFYEDELLEEYHIQKVFDLGWTIEKLKEVGFNTTIYTDFDNPGVHKGEKYFIIGEKK